MKIIQLNIWGGKLGQQIIDFLQAEQPDFVCLQEVHDLKGGRSGGKLFATLDEIQAGAGYSHVFMAPTYSFRHMERELEYGNALLSRFTLTSTETIFTHGQYKRHFDVIQDSSNIRNLQVAMVSLNGQPLHILNHHGYHVKGTKVGNEETLRATQLIDEVVGALEGPLILCGDFNLTPDSASLAMLHDRLTNLSVQYKLQTTRNQFSDDDHEVCDYIFVNDQIRVKNFAMSKALVADHQPLILEFDLKVA